MDRRLQVFVSSTYTDLLAERQAAVSAILKAGHIPAGMELFTAGDQSQLDVIYRWIDESDVYMLILGGRYGSIEPKSGLSYTELEYDYAVSKNKPLFAVALKDGAIEQRVKANGLAVAEMDNPALLKSFRAKVLSNLAAFFEDERDVKLAVFETLPNYAANRDLVGWVRGDQIVDSTAFREQSERLIRENEDLRAELAAAKQIAAKARDPDRGRMEDVIETLRSIPLSVPADVLPDGTTKAWETDQLTFLAINADRFVAGVTNRTDETELKKFLYWDVANILAVYGIMKNVKVQGSIRSYEVTPFGLKVMAELNARYHRNLKLMEASSKQNPATEAGTLLPKEAEADLLLPKKTAPGRKSATRKRLPPPSSS
ncbi:DUF4062 domain-containing protein [Stenotrophomonas indicatrix]